jgi:hypothetical protein
MMRRLLELALVAIAACKQGAPPPPPMPSGSAVPTASAGDGGPALVELLHAVSTTIVVSSQVANAAIKPEHLVDHDLNTAWNSRTGDLVGSWIRVTVPAGTQIEEVRMTVGHTGHGAKGEDYFTMNPRIAGVALSHGVSKSKHFDLDIARRDLQTLPVHGDGPLMIMVETCVSELEVWGTLPPGMQATPINPLVQVDVPLPPVDTRAFCDPARLEEARVAHEKAFRDGVAACERTVKETGGEDHCGVDEPGNEACSSDPIEITDGGPWSAAQDCEIGDDVYGPANCSITIHAGKDALAGPSASLNMASGRIVVSEAAVSDVLPGPPGELVLRYSLGETAGEQLIVCRTKPTAACSKPLDVAGDGWKARARFDKGHVVIEADTGTPPASVLGARALEFP